MRRIAQNQVTSSFQSLVSLASLYLNYHSFMTAVSLFNLLCACQVFSSFMMPTTSLVHKRIPVYFTTLRISVLLT